MQAGSSDGSRGKVVSALLVPLHFAISVVMLLVFSVGEGILFLFSKETSIPGLPTEKGEGDGRLQIDVLEADELTRTTLPHYIKNSEPVVIKGVPRALFDVLENYAPAIPPNYPTDKLLIDQFTFPRLGELSRWIREQTGKSIAYMARFSGGYSGGFAHIDSFPSYNFYVVKRGRKRVFIVPRQYNHLLDLANGYDSVFVKDDSADDQHMEWLEKLPGYYEFELEAGDVLLFNNSACIHKFMNLTENPEIFTLRLFSLDSSPLILKNDVLNWEGAKYFASILLNPTSIRDTYSV